MLCVLLLLLVLGGEILGNIFFSPVFTCGLLLMATLLYIFKAGTVPWEYKHFALHSI